MATADARAARERKQKMFVVIGGVVLLALLAFQLPRILGGSTPSVAPVAETTTAGDSAATPAVAPVPAQIPVALRDTDRPLTIAPGKLRSFSLFSQKDPFIQQVVAPAPSAGSTGSVTSGGPANGDAAKKTAKKDARSEGFTVGSTPAAAVTVISVNGGRQALAPGTAFPASDPVFVLVAEQPDAKAVVIGIAGGGYESGAKTTKLRIGKPLVLVNTTTGARYRLVLVAVGNGTAPGSAATGESRPPSP